MTIALACSLGSAGVASAMPPSHLAAATAQKKKKKKKKKHATAPVKCNTGQARLVVGKRATCVKNSLPVTHTTPQAAVIATTLTLQLGETRDRRGRHAPQLAKLLRRGGTGTQKLEQTIATGLAKGQTLLLASALGRRAHAAARPLAVAAVSCGASSKLEQSRKEYEEASPAEKAAADKGIAEVEKSTSFKNGELEAKVDLESGALKLGIDTKAKGVHIDLSFRTCGGEGLQLDSCPTAEGKLKGTDHSETEAAFSVTEGGKLVFAQGLKFKGETTISAQTGDDGKLDSYDIKHIYSLVGSFGGTKAKFGPITVDITYIGEAHIDMRSGGGAPPPATVDVMISMAGVDPAERVAAEIKVAHEMQTQADKEFAAEVEKTTKKLRAQEAVWLTPNKCATMHFEPASETLKLQKGQTGTFKSRAEASGGGAPPVATWTLSGQQNASFSPAAGSVNPLSTSYSVTNAGSGIVVSTVVKATSKAGVAEGTWKQKTGKLLKTISGTFSGKIENHGSLIEWSGTATFERVEIPEADPEVSSAFGLASASVEATASGAFQGADCTQSGSGPVALEQGTPVWTVEHKGETTEYQVIAPWSPSANVPVTLSSCNPSILNGEKDELILEAPAIQSGPVLGSISHTSFDGVTFEGGAFEERGGEKYSWSWSFRGSE